MKQYKRIEVQQTIDRLIDNEVHLNDPTGEFFVKVADGSLIDNKSFHFWEWTSGVGLYGMMRYYQLTRKPEVLTIMKDWFNEQFAKPPVEKNINTMVQMLTLAYLYEETDDQRYLPYLTSWADWLYYRLPRTENGGFQHVTYGDLNPGEMWADTLMMSVLTLAKLGQTLGHPEYTEEAKKQVLLHIQVLQDKYTGLWYHGWRFDQHDNFGGAFWGRGNSWITISFPELLNIFDLPVGDALRNYMITILTEQIDALAKYQDASGLWHTLINDPTSYLEGSATAGFTYGILKAVHDHYIDAQYKTVAMSGLTALFANIDDTGALARTSAGTPMGETKDFYKQIKISVMPYGQSMAALALTEYLKEFF